jgi:F-type H+-transporting ATPase subunit b
MKRFFRSLGLSLITVAVLAIAPIHAQEAQQKPEAQSAPAAEQKKSTESPEQHVTNPNTAVGKELSEASRAAEGEEEPEENQGLKRSAMVQKLAKGLGISVEAAYWIAMVINFAIIFAFIAWAMKKNLPGVFKARNEAIQRGIAEARAASDDAKRRLSDIEIRLSRLDSEVASIRGTAEKESAAEELRIREAAEAEVRRILESGEQEIDAAGKQARRDLKALAAGLAVDLAARKLQIDEKTDETLVREFVSQLGKGGK